MKIGVVSDTHGMPESWRKAEALFSGADLIIHAGDVLYHAPRLPVGAEYELPELARLINESPIPVVIARGNCDSEVYEELLETPVQSPYAIAQVEGVRIVVSHGHLVNRDDMVRLGKRFHARIFVSGHTHIPVIEEVDGVILLNPGSASLPKYERDGRPVASVGLITDDRIQILGLEDGSVLFEHRMV